MGIIPLFARLLLTSKKKFGLMPISRHPNEQANSDTPMSLSIVMAMNTFANAIGNYQHIVPRKMYEAKQIGMKMQHYIVALINNQHTVFFDAAFNVQPKMDANSPTQWCALIQKSLDTSMTVDKIDGSLLFVDGTKLYYLSELCILFLFALCTFLTRVSSLILTHCILECSV